MGEGEELVIALEKAGSEVARQRGSHVLFVHAGKTIKPGTFSGILRKAGLTVEELQGLL